MAERSEAKRTPKTNPGRDVTHGDLGPMVTLRPTAISGALVGGVAGGAVLGPLGAAVGFAIGGVAGDLLDRKIYPASSSLGPAAAPAQQPR